MRVLLTGYGGFLGRHVARTLRREGWSVRVVLLSRTVTRRQFAEEADELFWGSLSDRSALPQLVSGVDAVVHCAWDFRVPDAFPTPNQTMGDDLLREAVAAGVRAFAFISSVAVYGMKSGHKQAIDEDAPLVEFEGTPFLYPRDKRSTEEALRSAPRGNLRLGCFRPGPIFSDEKSPYKGVVPFFGRRGLGFGTGGNRMPYIHADDVASAVVAWLRNPRDGTVVNVTPDACLRHREWYRAWARERGRNIRPLFLPCWFMRSAALGATVLKRLLGKKGRVNVEYALVSATRNLAYSNARAKAELGWSPTRTNAFAATIGK